MESNLEERYLQKYNNGNKLNLNNIEELLLEGYEYKISKYGICFKKPYYPTLSFELFQLDYDILERYFRPNIPKIKIKRTLYGI